MSSNVLNTMFGYDTQSPEFPSRNEKTVTRPPSKTRSFEEEQIRSLVHEVFIQGGPKGPHQVVFTSADPGTNVTEICLQVGHTLAALSVGSVCIVETAHSLESPAEIFESREAARGRPQFSSLRDSALLLDTRLWLMPSGLFMREENALSASWLRGRIDELRLDFDFTIFQAPPAGECSDAPLLGHLCDGIVLVLTANSTRRVAARKIKDRLFSANARLLGTVLADRKFPIPEGIYRRL